jgi:hypothetical protein
LNANSDPVKKIRFQKPGNYERQLDDPCFVKWMKTGSIHRPTQKMPKQIAVLDMMDSNAMEYQKLENGQHNLLAATDSKQQGQANSVCERNRVDAS